MGALGPILIMTGAGLILAERLITRAPTLKNFPDELRYLIVTSQPLPNVPPRSLWKNLRRLHGMLIGFKRHTGPIRVTSGYRSPEVNEAAGGVEDSLHTAGRAVDLVLDTPEETRTVFDQLRSDPVQIAGLIQELILYEIEGVPDHLHVAMPIHGLEPQPTIQIVRRSGGRTVAGLA